MNIAILVPFYKTVPAKSCKCLIDLTTGLQSQGIAFSFIPISNTYLHNAREQLYDSFEKEKDKQDYDFVMHIDSDQTFSTEQVVSLLKNAEENRFDILSGVYFGEIDGKIAPVLLNKLDKETKKKMASQAGVSENDFKASYLRLTSMPSQQFFEVDACGFGFLACKPKVYESIVKKFGRPVFAPETEKGGKVKGEDIVWCERAKACGYKIMVDRSITIGHMGGEITLKDFRASLAQQMMAKRKV